MAQIRKTLAVKRWRRSSSHPASEWTVRTFVELGHRCCPTEDAGGYHHARNDISGAQAAEEEVRKLNANSSSVSKTAPPSSKRPTRTEAFSYSYRTPAGALRHVQVVVDMLRREPRPAFRQESPYMKP